MKTIHRLITALPMCIFGFITSPTHAQDLSIYRWEKRPVIIFTSSDTHKKYAKQMTILQTARPALDERDIVVLVDAKPTPPSSLRRDFLPRGFLFVLIGKDGDVKLTSEEPVSIEKLTETIDAMPMRQKEMTERG